MSKRKQNNMNKRFSQVARGATFKHRKVLVGHWFCLPDCTACDHEKTVGGKRQGNEAIAWLRMQEAYSAETGHSAPLDVLLAIEDWNK